MLLGKDIAQKLNYSYIELGNSNSGAGAEGTATSSTPFWTTGLYMDLSAPESAKELFDLCESNNIEVEVLINNAGIFFFKR